MPVFGSGIEDAFYGLVSVFESIKNHADRDRFNRTVVHWNNFDPYRLFLFSGGWPCRDGRLWRNNSDSLSSAWRLALRCTF